MMNRWIERAILCAGLGLATVALAAPPADAPAGTTGLCKDGTYSSSETKKGACKGHKGVKEWYAAAPAEGAKDAAKAKAKEAKTEAETKAKGAGEQAKQKAEAREPAAAAAPGGGPGLVWVNTSSKVYHCQSDRWYGRTKAGEYMSESAAKSKGYHAERGKACE